MLLPQLVSSQIYKSTDEAAFDNALNDFLQAIFQKF
jgi:hypothetical protein